jgi:hypothetical protein
MSSTRYDVPAGHLGWLFEVDRTCKVNGADGNLEREQD